LSSKNLLADVSSLLFTLISSVSSLLEKVLRVHDVSHLDLGVMKILRSLCIGLKVEKNEISKKE
jgi:hypothetical protein